jgi:hypothetical protein
MALDLRRTTKLSEGPPNNLHFESLPEAQVIIET